MNTKKYFIGMDSGGTKTAGVLTDAEGKILAQATGGAGNFLIIGTDKVAETLSNLVNELCSKAGISPAELSLVASGHTGAGRDEDAGRMREAFMKYRKEKEKGTATDNVFIFSDARIALEGAHSGRPGSILIAGTGSIMFGKDSNKNIHRVGGLGRFIGDEGSGYTLGRKGFNLVSKFFDGRIEKTSLAEILISKYNLKNNMDIISAVYKNNFDMASIAADVIKCAGEEDEGCIKIVEEETDEIILHLKAMYKLLGQKIMDVALIGSIITTDNFMAKLFREKVKKLEMINIKDSDLSPQEGAILLAREEAGI